MGFIYYETDAGAPVQINNVDCYNPGNFTLPPEGGIQNLIINCDGRIISLPCSHTDTPPSCSVNPQSTPNAGEYNIEIFTSDVESPVTIESIDFGDGSPVDTSGNGNYNHNYALGASYTITVTVSDGINPDETCTIVLAVPAANQPPECGFVAQIVNNRAEIISTSHSDPDGDPTTVWYNLIDSNGLVVESYNGQSGYPHTFSHSVPGVYSITQIVGDGTDNATCFVAGLEIVMINTPPTCGFTAESTGSLIRVLTNTAADPDSDPLTIVYELVLNGTTTPIESATNPTLPYTFTTTAVGMYQIRQTVTDGNGGTSTCTSIPLEISGSDFDFAVVCECNENT